MSLGDDFKYLKNSIHWLVLNPNWVFFGRKFLPYPYQPLPFQLLSFGRIYRRVIRVTETRCTDLSYTAVRVVAFTTKRIMWTMAIVRHRLSVSARYFGGAVCFRVCTACNTALCSMYFFLYVWSIGGGAVGRLLESH